MAERRGSDSSQQTQHSHSTTQPQKAATQRSDDRMLKGLARAHKRWYVCFFCLAPKQQEEIGPRHATAAIDEADGRMHGRRP
jgi:hypothetical protein